MLLPILPLQDRTPVFVKLDRGDDDVRGVDADGYGGAVGLVAGDTVDVDHPFLTVDLGDLALAALVFAADDADFVIFADRE